MRTKFYTGKGDKGKSRVAGKSVSKDSPLLKFLGSLDELNSWLGFCRTGAKHNAKQRISRIPLIEETLLKTQEIIFIAQAETAILAFFGKNTPPNSPKVTNSHVKYLEAVIKETDKKIPPIKKFIVPGENELSARLDVARAMARKVEREAVMLKKKLSPEMLVFLNRLSSALFALARLTNRELKTKERNPSYDI